MGFFRWLLGPPQPSPAELATEWHEQSRGVGEESIESILHLLANAKSEYQGEGIFDVRGQYEAHQVKLTIDYSDDELELAFEVTVKGDFEIDEDDEEGEDVELYRCLPAELRTLVEAVLEEHEGTLELARTTLTLCLEEHEYDDPVDELPNLLSLMSRVAESLERGTDQQQSQQ